jgi:hypothetical protein
MFNFCILFQFFSKFISGPKNAKELVLNVHFEMRETETGVTTVTKINYNKDSIEITATYSPSELEDRTESVINVDVSRHSYFF